MSKATHNMFMSKDNVTMPNTSHMYPLVCSGHLDYYHFTDNATEASALSPFHNR